MMRAAAHAGRAYVTWIAAGAALILVGCAANRPNPRLRPPGPSSQLTAAQILPPDLDVVLWMDVARVKALWLREPEQQLTRLLHEYGLLPPTGDSNDAVFWGDALRLADRAWIACRPHPEGCRDPVVVLRGNYGHIAPRRAISKTEPPLDLGGGWLRYDRTSKRTRSTLARLYYSPPDRLVAVSETELDAVERSLERTRVRAVTSERAQPTESGLLSLRLRPSALARVVERRAPAAGRFLRDALSLELRVTPETNALAVLVELEFESRSRAELAAKAFELIQQAFARTRAEAYRPASPIEVQENRLVLRLQFVRPEPTPTGGAVPPPPTEPPAP